LLPVTGKVTIGGKPVTGGSVSYRPDKSKGNTWTGEAGGQINEQGEYTLVTKGQPGAPAGAYKVVVVAGPPITGDNTKPKASFTIGAIYQSYETTPLNIEVSDKATPGTYDLKVGR
jgi:hypothetical protein